MLTQIELEHFKCFSHLCLPLGELTLLSGTNASGKSSVLQSLVLLQQTMRDDEWSERLLLNGSTMALGTRADIVDKETGRKAFAIGLGTAGDTIRWELESDDPRAMSVPVKAVTWNGHRIEPVLTLRSLIPVESGAAFSKMVGSLRRLSYVAAERIGPREIYPMVDPSRAHALGAQGENAVGLLHVLRDEPVRPKICREGIAPLLFHQTQAALQRFFPGCSIEVTPVPQANGVTLGLRTSNATDFHRPQHVGFGLSHVLPILVAALVARDGDLLLIENPEVHLHPAGQALMGRFLSEVAASGVQVLLETHSDHVLNGVRRAVRDGVLARSSAALHFFRDRTQPGEQVVSPQIDAQGNLDHWPDGFFDQFDKDTAALAGWDR